MPTPFKSVSCLFRILLLFSSGLADAQIALLQDSISSTILGEKRYFSVSLPKDFAPGSGRKFPVLYLLDGDSHISYVASMVRFQSEVMGNTTIPPMIVVGIKNTKRTRDFTPYKAITSGLLPEVMAKETGGADHFIAFLEKELIPYLEAKYPTAPYRLLVGHSFGGLLGLQALISKPTLFTDYIVIDPSLWYDNENFSRIVQKKITELPFQNQTLFMTIGNNMPGKQNSQVLKDTSLLASHQKSILLFTTAVKAGKRNGIAFESVFYPIDDHGSAPMLSIYDGLRYLFKDFRTSIYEAGDPAFDPLKTIPVRIESLGKKLGTAQTPTKELLLNFGYLYGRLDLKQREKDMYTLLQRYFPKEGIGYELMGDYYKAAGQQEQALLYLKQALAVEPKPELVGKIRDLEEKLRSGVK
jgi:uncharacterized protein